MVAETATISRTAAPAGKPRKSLFQDSITVEIPIDVTADLGIAIRQTRKKRIAGILALFPALKTKEVVLETNKDEAEEGKEGDDEQKDVDTNITHRHMYGSVLDYLEAKYVRGVMLQEEGDEGDAGGDEEEEKAGSVYDDSDGSFLDDSLLQRDVAEQVISQATHTKLELEDEDADFFVNVGDLEVEDHDLMEYDPVQEEHLSKKRKLEGGTKKAAAKKPGPKKAQTEGETTKVVAPKDPVDVPKTIKEVASKNGKPISFDKVRATELKEKADACKKVLNQHFAIVSKAIKKMGHDLLPRRKTMEKVSIVVPAGKSAGDDVTFSNPHVPGQKLRVKVPKHTLAGGKFVVSVPVPQVDDGVDRNKFGREWQDMLNAFSLAHDDWTSAQALYMGFIKEKFPLHQQRMNKFNDLIAVFPKDLMTPVDGPYMRKIVRRARQAATKRAIKEGATPEKIESAMELEPAEKGEPSHAKQLTMVPPGKGKCFARIQMNLKEFVQPEQDAEDQAAKDAITSEFTTNNGASSDSPMEDESLVDPPSPLLKGKTERDKLEARKPGMKPDEEIYQEANNKPTNDTTMNIMTIAMEFPLKGTVFKKILFTKKDFYEDPDGRSLISKNET